jgi:lipoyl(octanoyl) transferase
MSHEFRIPSILPPAPLLHAHLFEQVPHDDFEHLQRRLAYEAASRNDGLISLLIAEHPQLITIGRVGSREHIQYDDAALAKQALEWEFVNRGGGCILHRPGQLSIALVVPLARLKWSVGDYLRRVQIGLEQLITKLGVTPRVRSQRLGVWGKSGVLAALGVHIRHGFATYGAYLNVNPSLAGYDQIATIADDEQPNMGSLLAEKATAGRMNQVRAMLPTCMAEALSCEQCQVFTGHSLLPAANHVAKLTA